MATKPFFEQRIDELCDRYGENRTSLSEKASLSPYTVRNWIASARDGNSTPGRARELRKFAKRWKVTVAWLTEEPEPEPATPTAPEPDGTPAPVSLPYAAERERAAAKLVLMHSWKLEEAVAAVLALLAFAHGEVTEDHFVQGALRSRAAMRGRVGERPKAELLGVIDEGKVGEVGGLIERGAALAKKKGEDRGEHPRSTRKIKRASEPHD